MKILIFMVLDYYHVCQQTKTTTLVLNQNNSDKCRQDGYGLILKFDLFVNIKKKKKHGKVHVMSLVIN